MPGHKRRRRRSRTIRTKPPPASDVKVTRADGSVHYEPPRANNAPLPVRRRTWEPKGRRTKSRHSRRKLYVVTCELCKQRIDPRVGLYWTHRAKLAKSDRLCHECYLGALSS